MASFSSFSPRGGSFLLYGVFFRSWEESQRLGDDVGTPDLRFSLGTKRARFFGKKDGFRPDLSIKASHHGKMLMRSDHRGAPSRTAS